MHLLYPILVFIVGLAADGQRRLPAGPCWQPPPPSRHLPSPARPLDLVVIVPAHNEELVLAGTLDSLGKQDYPAGCFEIVVVADNCLDTTAALAGSHGVTVMERTHAEERGKGYALNHAFAHLLSRPEPAEGFVIVDADTWVAPDFLTRMSARLVSRRGARTFPPPGRAATGC